MAKLKRVMKIRWMGSRSQYGWTLCSPNGVHKMCWSTGHDTPSKALRSIEDCGIKNFRIEWGKMKPGSRHKVPS